MKIDFRQMAPNESKVIDLLITNGAHPYLVGGTVRDLLLYKEIQKNDFDVEVYKLSISEISTLLTKNDIAYTLQGNFGVIKIKDCNLEISLPRIENKIGKNHVDFAINIDPFMSSKLAIERRDFTINTFMYDLKLNQLLENQRAETDLKNRVLMHVSNKFSEDPLRILRAIRLSVCHNLSISIETHTKCLEIINQLNYISIERIDAELAMIMQAKYLNQQKQYLNIFLQSFLNLDIDVNTIEFSNILAINYSLIVRNLTKDEQQIFLKYILNKKVRNNIKLIAKNWDVNLMKINILYEYVENLSLVQLILEFQLFIKQITDDEYNLIINNIHQIIEYKKLYNGYYFIKQGINGKEIKVKQKLFILTKFSTSEI